jgi:hypothetical protein
MADNKIEIDMRLLSIITLAKKHEKAVLTNAIKTAIREGNYTTKLDSYGTIQLKNYTKSYYSEEDQAKIDKFIEENGIKKISETTENYTIEIVPSEKAVNEYNKMLTEEENSQHKNLSKLATQLKQTL